MSCTPTWCSRPRRPRPAIPFLALSVLVALVGARVVSAQEAQHQSTVGTAPAGVLRGVVTDETGAVVAQVELTLVNDSDRMPRKVVSDGDGAYAFADLPPGTYRLTAIHEGFEPARLDGLV